MSRPCITFILTALSLVVPTLAGCPETNTSRDAASADAAGSHTPLPPTAPTPPALPILTPCPAGWHEVTVGTATACEPFADESTPRCGADELLVHGRAAGMACEPALACPSGAWPDDAAADAVYVRAGATGGDGSRGRPFGTLAEGVSAAAAGAHPLVLGEGELTGGVQIAGIPSITGLCPERTRIVDTTTTMSAPLIVRAGNLTLRGVHLEGALYGLWLTNGAVVSAEGVVAEGLASAIRLDGGATLDGSRIRAESPRTNELEAPALRLGPEAVATLRASTVLGGGSLVYGYKRSSDASTVFATVTIEDSSLLDAPVGLAGRLEATVRRSSIDAVGVGAVTISPRTTVLEDVRARGVGVGVGADSAFVNGAGGTTRLTRVSMLGVEHGAALLALGSLAPDATVIAEDLVVSAVPADVAIHAEEGASLTLSRVGLFELGGTAIQGAGGSHVMASDVTIGLTAGGTGGLFGSAFAGMGEGTTFVIDRVSAAPVAYGLAFLDGASATASDVAIEGGLGLGVQCDPGAGCVDRDPLLVLERVSVRGAVRYGLAVIGARASVHDLDVDGVEVPDPTMAAPGLGVLAYAGGLAAERVRIQRVSGIGMIALGSTIEARSVEVAATRLRACPSCASGTLGDGMTCATDGELRVSDFTIRGSERAGLTAASGCRPPSFGVGVLEENGIGILTDESVDAALFRSLLVRGNGTDYDRTNLSLGAAELGLSDSSL
ncbi:MAG: hypothetical protein K1X94_27555 [Sandaracinaceae bacterium]|nr:hypothetical protein [Sandaracinaceae bacterium]